MLEATLKYIRLVSWEGGTDSTLRQRRDKRVIAVLQTSLIVSEHPTLRYDPGHFNPSTVTTYSPTISVNFNTPFIYMVSRVAQSV
jgi:hypothetical protein